MHLHLGKNLYHFYLFLNPTFKKDINYPGVASDGDGPCVHDLSTLGTAVSIEVFFTSVLPPIKTQTIKLKNMFTLCSPSRLRRAIALARNRSR